MQRALLVAVLLCTVLPARPAMAQQQPIVTLTPEHPLRWDAAAGVGWFGGNRSGTAGTRGDNWSESAVFGASAGFYWTQHVKVEADAGVTTWGSVFLQEFPGPSSPPLYRFGEHRFRSFRASGLAIYQFPQNTWFHPFVGAGLEGSREQGERELQEQLICTAGPCVPSRVTRERIETTRVRPLAAAGFKWYVSDRAFIRSDIRAAFSAGRTEAGQWRVVMGADF